MSSNQSAMPTNENVENLNNKINRGRGKNKRFWSRDEEWGLVHLLMELSTDPKWKADGNFKSGYLQKLEKMMNEKLPGCGLTSTQIESKVKQFREKHNVIMVMLGTSGFSWDDTNKMIKCERQSYDEFLKKYKNAKGLWGISFPFLDDLDKVFGADRANGGACEDYTEAVETLQNDNEAVGIDNNIIGEDKDDDEFFTQTSHTGKKTKKENYAKGKAKMKNPEAELNSSIINVSSNISSFLGGMSSHFSTIASAFSTTQDHELAIMAREEESEAKKKDLEVKKQSLFHEVSSIPGLSRTQTMLAVRKLSSDENNLSLFYHCPDDEWKKEFILNLINPDMRG